MWKISVLVVAMTAASLPAAVIALETEETEKVMAVYGITADNSEADIDSSDYTLDDKDYLRQSKSLLNTFPFNQAGFASRTASNPTQLVLQLSPEQQLQRRRGATVNRGVARQRPNRPVTGSITGYSLIRDGESATASIEATANTASLPEDDITAYANGAEATTVPSLAGVTRVDITAITEEDLKEITEADYRDNLSEFYKVFCESTDGGDSDDICELLQQAIALKEQEAKGQLPSSDGRPPSKAGECPAPVTPLKCKIWCEVQRLEKNEICEEVDGESTTTPTTPNADENDNDTETGSGDNTTNPSGVLDTSLDSLSNLPPNENGKRCINKVMMVEETVYDDVVTCDHSYDRQCHTSYTTTFEAQQEEDCEENYMKNCFINYDKVAFNQTVQICRNPLVTDCSVEGEPICRTEFESECYTHQHEHEVEDDVVDCQTVQETKCEDVTVGYTTEKKCKNWPRSECTVKKALVKKYSPVTSCKKVPRQLCAPAGCGFKEGAEICYDKVQTIVQDKPTEECHIEPQRTCKHVTKLVPKLEPSEECVDVPKEVCSRSRRNPKKIKKPVIKKWCYVPTEESGLA